MFISSAYAQTAGAAASGGTANSLFFFVQMAVLLFAGWFLLIRPQQRRMKALRTSIEAVKKGDQVVTAGGIVGRVTKVEDAYVEVEIAANTRVRVVKATLTEVVNPTAKPAND